MKIGYARVSTHEQNLALQRDALKRAGCELVFTDHGISGSEFNRPGLKRALSRLRADDVLVVWRLDRLGRSLPKLVELIQHMEVKKIGFESVTESITTQSSGGMLVFHMMAALAQFERALISERTRAGMQAARDRGKVLGRRRALNEQQRRHALELMATSPLSEIARRFNVHPRTLRRLQLEHQARASPFPKQVKELSK
ncbi:recombinase family protein [Burkholderia sp. BCC0405]|uniref:recombinase family protein n=1 Tax=Burkholderia sp. BCC0405 TaxID=2676298 RepID=UPI00158B7B91|nr:recombinase family protein [Burkholderia sp. BCC0405]